MSDSQRGVYSVELDAVRLEFECHQEQRLRENSPARKKWLALVIANVAFKSRDSKLLSLAEISSAKIETYPILGLVDIWIPCRRIGIYVEQVGGIHANSLMCVIVPIIALVESLDFHVAFSCE